MNYYIGIDLGTTNSVICSFDGQNVRVWKSPEQNDVTPSAIYIDKRGNRYYGTKAYNMMPTSPNNAAVYFKRLMGTSTPINLSAVNITMTPEECSAEILRVLFGYIPEEIRNSDGVATVITVPAAFDQMQNEATLEAAKLAGLGKVALMQEPVAAIMSVMRTHKQDGTFLIYDLGGGTLDIAIAESIGGKVNLLSHGGIAMCGGRDFDRLIFNNIVMPWMMEKFNLPEDFKVNPKYKSVERLALWAAESAKIELSSKDESVISLSETETRTTDLDGNDIYLDIRLTRYIYDKLVSEMIDETIMNTREIIAKVGLSPYDFDRIVFIGGPPIYEPIRKRVSTELGIKGSFEVNSMTAVAEGASIFAESIDWTTQRHNRKSISGQMKGVESLDINFKYIARTIDNKSKIIAQINDKAQGYTFEIKSSDTGWVSGKMALVENATTDLPVTKDGENVFIVSVYNSFGQGVKLEENRIIITKTMATVGAIPAPHSIGVEVLDQFGGTSTSLEYLIQAGDLLPKKGIHVFKTTEALKAGSSSQIMFRLWSGEITNPVSDNKLIGTVNISGTDFDMGIIPAGGELECEYEMSDSASIMLVISVPDINVTKTKNFYSRAGGLINFADATERVVDEGQKLIDRIDDMLNKIEDERLKKARIKAERAASLGEDLCDEEDVKHADDGLQDAKKLIWQTRNENLKVMRQADLDGEVGFFNEYVRQYARPAEVTAFDNLVKTAQRSIDRNDKNYENQLNELRSRLFPIMWRQDWFIVDRFNYLTSNPYKFDDRQTYGKLKDKGLQYVKSDEMDKLREVVIELYQIQTYNGTDDEFGGNINIVRG